MITIHKHGLILIIFLLSKCCAQKEQHIIENSSTKTSTKNNLLNVTKKIITDTNDTLKVEVFQDEKRNLYILLKNKWGFLLDIGGSGRSDVEKGDTVNFISKYNLDNDSISEYVIKTYLFDANWDAGIYYVLWAKFDDIKYAWQLTKVDLFSPYVEDRNQDGIYEIVEYYDSKNKGGDVYRFEKGKLIPIE